MTSSSTVNDQILLDEQEQNLHRPRSSARSLDIVMRRVVLIASSPDSARVALLSRGPLEAVGAVIQEIGQIRRRLVEC